MAAVDTPLRTISTGVRPRSRASRKKCKSARSSILWVTRPRTYSESFNLAEDEAKQYETVKAKFEGYFDKRRNTIYDRAQFNMRVQQDNETVNELVADLHRLAKHCNYGSLTTSSYTILS